MGGAGRPEDTKMENGMMNGMSLDITSPLSHFTSKWKETH